MCAASVTIGQCCVVAPTLEAPSGSCMTNAATSKVSAVHLQVSWQKVCNMRDHALCQEQLLSI